MTKRKIDFKLLSIIFISLLLLTVVGIAAVYGSYALNDSIYGGVKIDGRELGGMTKAQAEQVIIADIDKIRTTPILKIKHADKNWQIMSTDIEWSVDIKTLVQKAYEVGRTGNLLEQLKERFYTYNQGTNISLVSDYNQNKLKTIIVDISASLNSLPSNASIEIIAGEQKITPEVNGVKVDEVAAFSMADKAIKEKISSEIALPAKITQPEITAESLKNITDILGTYTTHFNPWQVDRTHNVALAAKYLDGKLLKPNDTFSFNKTIGQRTQAMGYRDAPVYLGEEIVPGIGGGICQISSTLYNAVLLANLNLVERENHIRPVTYVPIGQDATIAGDIIDLKFKNDTNENIYIKSKINYNEVTIELLGKKPNNFPSVKIVADNLRVIPSKSVVKQDKTMLVGTKKVEREGENGYKITTYRLKYVDNKLIEREKLYEDYYPVIDEIVLVGAKVPDNVANKDDTEKNISKEKS